MSLTAHSQTSVDEALRELDGAAVAALKSIKPIIDREIPLALDRFYARAVSAPRSRAFFSDPAAVQRARAAQIQHWSQLSSGAFEGATSRRMGRIHADLGVAPDVYISGYGQIAGHLVSAVIPEIWPRGAQAVGPFARGGDAAAAVSALMSIAMLDMELGVAAFIEAVEAKRAVAEATASRLSQEFESVPTPEARGPPVVKRLDTRSDERPPGGPEHMKADFKSAISGLREAMAGVTTSLPLPKPSTGEIATAARDRASEVSQIGWAAAGLASVPLAPVAIAVNRHCEERSDEAIQRPQAENLAGDHGAAALRRFARNDVGSTQKQQTLNNAAMANETESLSELLAKFKLEDVLGRTWLIEPPAQPLNVSL